MVGPTATGGAAMSDPAGSDRIQQDVPTASGRGDNSDTGASFEDVPLTREEAVQRDASQPDDLPATADSDIAAARRAEAADEP
jgi:hypothetical protein